MAFCGLKPVICGTNNTNKQKSKCCVKIKLQL